VSGKGACTCLLIEVEDVDVDGSHDVGAVGEGGREVKDVADLDPLQAQAITGRRLVRKQPSNHHEGAGGEESM
jgi:hypothetical protein